MTDKPTVREVLARAIGPDAWDCFNENTFLPDGAFHHHAESREADMTPHKCEEHNFELKWLFSTQILECRVCGYRAPFPNITARPEDDPEPQTSWRHRT